MLKRPNIRKAFTLIELLVVILILAILAAMIVPRIINKAGDAKRAKAASDIAALRTALTNFKLDTGTYPTTEEGLLALEQDPGNVNNWKGPYTEKAIPPDPWFNEYIYTSDGETITLTSYGSDGQPGGEGEAADIDPVDQ
ncbi:MAG: type II secretion system major pseudopilin GspG [Fimbriimonadaceae bacterium]|nr:type II secretion system major pseudopilin GspG [Fimbriimonadaceae bacterium]